MCLPSIMAMEIPLERGAQVAKTTSMGAAASSLLLRSAQDITIFGLKSIVLDIATAHQAQELLGKWRGAMRVPRALCMES